MFAQGGINHTAVETDLGRIGDGRKDTQRVVKLLAVIVFKGQHPRFDFLPHLVSKDTSSWG